MSQPMAQPMPQPAYGQPMAQPLPQQAYGQPMVAQPMYGQPMMIAAEPLITPQMNMPFIMALLGSIFLLIGGGLIIGSVMGLLCLIFVILIVVTKNRMWAMLTWIFALVGMVIAIASIAWNAWQLSLLTYCQIVVGIDICGPVRGVFYIGIGLNVLGIVGGILALLGGRKMQGMLPTAAPMFVAPMAQPMQPMYQQPMQPMYQQPMQPMGQPLAQPPVQPMAAQPPVQPATAAVQPMAQPSSNFCKSCGQAVVGGAMFCPNCGSRY